jgi:uncharacterized protein with HEPN domain
MKDERLYIVHILEAIERIETYVHGDENVFRSNEMVFDAVLRNLQTMSEATQRLPEAIKEQFPEIKWREISGFRNVLVHDYLGGIDHAVVWRVIVEDMPQLKSAMLTKLPDWASIRKS